MLGMSSKKSPPDRHKPNRMVRLPSSLCDKLDKIAAEEFNSLTQQVVIAVREYLQRKGHLPRPDAKE